MYVLHNTFCFAEDISIEMLQLEILCASVTFLTSDF